MMLSMLITVHPLGGDLVRRIGLLSLSAATRMARGESAAGELHDVAELHMLSPSRARS